MADQQPTPKIDWARIKSLAVHDSTLLVVYADGQTEKIRCQNKVEMMKALENRQETSTQDIDLAG